MRRLLDPRLRRGLLLLWCVGWLVILVASLRPVPEPLIGLSDKLLHFVAYAVMAAAAAGFCHEPRRLLGWAMVAVAIGGLVELAQGLLPWRSAELADLVADAAGAGVGWLLGLAWLALLIRPLRRGVQPA